MASPESDSIDKEAVSDDHLWRALTKLSKIFPGKGLGLYESTVNEAKKKVDKDIITALHSFAALSIRFGEVVAASMSSATADHLSLFVCKTNDSEDANDDESNPNASYSIVRNTRPSDRSPASDGEVMYIAVARKPTFPKGFSAAPNVFNLLAEKWRMKWEEHVGFLTYIANKSSTMGDADAFRTYSVLAGTKKHEHRLLKTPILIRNYSYYDTITNIGTELIATLPISSIPYGSFVSRNGKVKDFLTIEDLISLRIILENESFKSLAADFVKSLVKQDATVVIELDISQQQEQLLVAGLWEIVRHSLTVLKSAFGKVDPGTVNADVLRDVWSDVHAVFLFLKHSVHNSNWMRWLFCKHWSADIIVERVCADSGLSDSVSPQQQEDQQVGDGEEDVELDMGTDLSATGRPNICNKIFAWFALICSPMAQVDTVIQYLKRFKKLEVTIVASPDPDSMCLNWQDAIREAFKLSCADRGVSEDTALNEAESVIYVVKNLYAEGTERDKRNLAPLFRRWRFTGAVHCETVLASEILKMSTTGNNQLPEAAKSVSRYIGPSKRCCPMCSIILCCISEELGKEKAIPILFRHSLTCESALPLGLPKKVRQKAIEELASNLAQTLKEFLKSGRTESAGSQQSHALSPTTKNAVLAEGYGAVSKATFPFDSDSDD
ncbi:hypothetical protein BJ508DRAFT_418246 [Ascobolus immersus RN42]|uniref:Uncharacterized protein n=1 Tax=Ascobolus immersus RN42 TaxID=1160509 RepID=A0A3N4HN75_ASCIM|nr:hypothetical protein BJ508DRAFT_418246 [Ascobolus immersus RN42]